MVTVEFIKIIGKTHFSEQFKEIVILYETVGYNDDILRMLMNIVR